ncbi:MAG: hypothetical protein E6G22_01555 [Actinobacteria bacterium]|nr:MAG: hypothetical protein E6G22_01555 [Actinomycetota bacterium]
MRRPVVIALAASAVALGGAPGALAADHLWLDARASLSSGWDLRVSGNTDDNSFAGGVPSSGVLNVALQLRRGGAQEYHGYGSAQDELSFDGTAGRLRIVGNDAPSLEADLTLEATGLPAPDLRLACPGTPMYSVAVALTGTLRLRTGLRLLGTVRVNSLAGTVEYNDGPAGPCFSSSTVPPPICRDGRALATAQESTPFVDVSWDSRPLYRYARITYRHGAWSHSLEVPLMHSPFSGRLGELRVKLPRRGPLRGTLVFHLQRRETPSKDPTCGTTQTISAGTVTGRVVAAFRAWRTRTAVFADAAGFVVDDPS